MNYKNFFFFDIETVSGHEDFDEFGAIDEAGSASFYKRWKRRKGNNSMWNDDIRLAYKINAPLTPEYGKIVSIAYAFFTPSGELTLAAKSISNDNEEEFVNWIKRLFDKVSELKKVPCGHNIKGFDIPYIVKKIMKYGMKVPSVLNTLGKKPWEVNMFDTSDAWKGTAWDVSSLDELTLMLGLESPKDEMTGAMVSEAYWNDNDIEGIEKYCLKDTKALVEICEKIQYSMG